MMNWQEIFASRTQSMKASEIRELLKLLEQPDIISFAGGIPDPALFPKEEFQSAFSEILGSVEADKGLQYSVSEGYHPLRSWLVEQMAEMGVPCTTDNIFITSGSQQGLDYLGKLFLSPKDTAVVEWPTYLGAIQAFRAYEPCFDQLNLTGNRSPQSYIDQAQAQGGIVKMLYASVDFANPTGKTLNLSEREALLDLSKDIGAPVIEDAAYQALRFDGRALPPVMALDVERSGGIENTNTIYCGSFSKTLSPGLRVGWVCAASDVINKLVLIKQASDLHSPTLNQMAVHRVVQTGFKEQIERIKSCYKDKRDAMLSALNTYMPDTVQWTTPEGGMFVWVTLPQSIDAVKLLEASVKEQKVAFVPGSAFHPDGTGANTMRLNFSRPDKGAIQTGIEKLAVAMSQMA
ncbi:MAG: PLP-dependent aminotransferase family protein [Lentilitoribacter sp.]